LSLGQFAGQVAAGTRFVRVKNGEDKREKEKNRGEPAGDFGEHIRGLGAEDIFRNAAAKGRAKALAFRALHQDDKHHEDRVKDVDAEENVDQQAHLGRAIWRNRGQKQTPNAERPTPNVDADQTLETRF
jgi:hypothetical protein